MNPSDGLVLEKQLLMALLTYLPILGLMLAGVKLASTQMDMKTLGAILRH